MTSSLVGSEMCIRDRYTCGAAVAVGIVYSWYCQSVFSGVNMMGTSPVSYTHLTLPDDMQCVDLG
eukprot:6249756-Prorocentrum_lima.AAC.1